MSWLFSRALVEEFSAASCSDGEPFAQLSGSPIPQAFCAPDKTTAFSRLSRFGMTFKPLTADRGEELLMSFRAGFHVKTSALQEKAQASTESEAGCGATWRGSLARFDLASSSWKTAQPSLLGDLEESLVTWPRSGMTAGGLCWELVTLERRTGAKGSGLWPTPTVCGNNNRKGISPKAGDGLATAVKRFATPLARDWRSGKASQATHEKNSRPLSEQVGGSLNPTWVEWLMGWPLGWTDLKPLETVKFPYAPQQHGES